MLETKRWTTALAAAGVLLLGGLTATNAQEAEDPGLDVDALSERMELDDEARADLSKLGDLLQRRQAMREGMAGLRSEMRATMQALAGELTVEQFRELHRQMRATMQMGPPGGHGMRGGAMMGRGGRMGGGMQGAHMRGMQGDRGPGHAMPGRGMHRGAAMGAGAGVCPWLQDAPDAEEGDGETP